MADHAIMTTSALRALVGAAATAVLIGLPIAPPASAADVEPLETIPAPADGIFRMSGSGWGHGRGMSQWGAYQAAAEGRTHAQILAFYYPGTELAKIASPSVRVLLTADTGRDLVVHAVSGLKLTETGKKAAALPTTPKKCTRKATRWRVRAAGSVLRLDAYCGKWRTIDKNVGRTVSLAVSGGLVGTQNGSDRRGYRGSVSATLVGSASVQVVNKVPMEQYLRGVVAAEVSASWPAEALEAQAVAARTYAAHGSIGRAKSAFDVYDTTRSQVYPGAVAYDSSWRVVRWREYARTDAAIAATEGLQVTYKGAPALTQFSSSSGGVTASSPLPYLVASVDGWDARATKNPRRAWTDTISVSTLQRSYPSAGKVTAIEVLGREGDGALAGRLTSIRIVGSKRSYVLASDSAIRAALGTYSSVVTFTSPKAKAAKAK